MIKGREQKNQEDQEEQEENLLIYKDLFYLKDEAYFRQQVLQILMKIQSSMEKQAQAMEDLATPTTPSRRG